MKKLRNKVFFTIFSILTSVIIIILITTTTKDYFERKDSISKILSNISRTPNGLNNKEPNFPPNNNPGQDVRKIYLDFTIYTIILDDSGVFQEIINNTNNEEIDTNNIETIANEIINNHEDNVYIGNLYFNKYSYAFSDNNTIIIVY